MPGAPPSRVKSPHAIISGHSQSTGAISTAAAETNKGSLAASPLRFVCPVSSKAVTSAPMLWALEVPQKPDAAAARERKEKIQRHAAEVRGDARSKFPCFVRRGGIA